MGRAVAGHVLWEELCLSCDGSRVVGRAVVGHVLWEERWLGMCCV